MGREGEREGGREGGGGKEREGLYMGEIVARDTKVLSSILGGGKVFFLSHQPHSMQRYMHTVVLCVTSGAHNERRKCAPGDIYLL